MTNNRAEELLQQSFIALTARWRHEDGELAIGISKSKLLKAAEINQEELQELLNNLRNKANSFGLELIEYLYRGDVWYAIRSGYACPSELKSEEEALLATIITAIETGENQKTSLDILKKKLVNGKYFSEYQLERYLRNLEQFGYIQRKSKIISYSPRTLLEFSEESRKHIAEESTRFIF